MTTRYTKDHEYVRVEGDTAVVGISDYAQEQLGDVVYVELPAVGKILEKGGEAAVVESVKAASDLFSPISGEVVEVNEALRADPSLANSDPLAAGWFMKVRIADSGETASLLSRAAYDELVKAA